MNLSEITEIIGFISTFLLGFVCFRAYRNGNSKPVVLFWVGVTFLVISSVRFGAIAGFLNLQQTRAITGVFYPFALTAILLDNRRIKFLK